MAFTWEEAEVAALDRVWPNVSSWMRDESRSRSRSTFVKLTPKQQQKSGCRLIVFSIIEMFA